MLCAKWRNLRRISLERESLDSGLSHFTWTRRKFDGRQCHLRIYAYWIGVEIAQVLLRSFESGDVEQRHHQYTGAQEPDRQAEEEACHEVVKIRLKASVDQRQDHHHCYDSRADHLHDHQKSEAGYTHTGAHGLHGGEVDSNQTNDQSCTKDALQTMGKATQSSYFASPALLVGDRST